MKLRLFLCCAALLCLSSGRAFSQVSSNQIYVGLVDYWPMDTFVTNAAAGLVTTPDVVSHNDMAVVNGASQVAGKFGNAVSLNLNVPTTNQYLVNTNTGWTDNLASGQPIVTSGGAPSGVGPYTITMWVNGPPQSTTYLLTEGSTTNNNPILLLQCNTTAAPVLNGYLRNVAGIAAINHPVGSLTCLDSTWHHIAWVDNQGVVSIYIDGNLDSKSSAFSYLPTYLINPNGEAAGPAFSYQMPMNTTAIGVLNRAALAGYYSGLIDDVAVWQRALSQAEVQYVMSNSIAQPVPAGPPVFMQPLAGQTNSMGDYVVLQSWVTPPATVQWFENGQMISGATNADLVVIDTTSPGTNHYSVVAANSYGQSTNGPAAVVLVPDPPPALTNGCLGYWPMDAVNAAATFTNTPDVSFGNNFSLVNMSSANVVAGEFTNALTFDGATTYGYVAGTGSLPYSATNYTVSFWVNGTMSAIAAQNAYLYENSSTANATPLFGFSYPQSVLTYYTNLNVFIRNDQGTYEVPNVISSNSVFDGAWHHIVWADQAGSAMLYIDGVLDGSAYSYVRTNANQAVRTNNSFTLNAESIGALYRTTVGNWATVELCDLAWWNRRLSLTEIRSLQSNAVSAPAVFLAPSFVQNPTSITNAYVGDSDTFTVSVVGSQPITFQWFYTTNATGTATASAISTSLNPSAGSNVLTLTNLQLTNTGYYFVTASNSPGPGGLAGGGVRTSAVVQLVVHNYLAPPTNVNATVLQLQFVAAQNFLSPPADFQPGWQTMSLLSGHTVFNGSTKVTLSALGGAALQDRDRGVQNATTGSAYVIITNIPPVLTTAALYNSFIYDSTEAAGTGIDILIQHLNPSTTYGVNLWCYGSSGAGRYEDWVEALSGTTIASQFSESANNPAADWQDTIGALLTSDPNGQLDIQGTYDALTGANVSVFLNGLMITANPLPQVLSAVIAADGNLLITAQAQYSGQTIVIQESPDLIHWNLAQDGVNATSNSPIFTWEFPLSTNHMFYRALVQ